MSSRHDLRLDWCGLEAAKYAVQRWHYSGRLPAGKSVRIGVWESGQFVGCVIFSRGATAHIGRPYGLPQTKVAELTRVALGPHRAPVTRIIRIALSMLKRHSPGLELVVSYADIDRGHTGTIYRAGNWVYEGVKCAGHFHYVVDGKRVHPRRLMHEGSMKEIRKHHRVEIVKHRGKHKFLMALTGRMREQLRAAGVGGDTAGSQLAEAGSNPSAALNEVRA